jgi:serpin B
MPVTRHLSRRQFLALSGAAAANVMLGGCSRADDPKPADAAMLAAGNTAFATDLYAQLRKDKGNLFLSPFSISTALAMTAAGAKGQTLAEMRKVLHLPEDPHSAFSQLLAPMYSVPPGGLKRAYELSVANALWGQKGFPWKPEFTELTRKFYAAGLNEVDFAETEAARKVINDWVAAQTKEKIKDLIGPGVLDRDTRLVLTNAIYFKSAWFFPFNKGATQTQPFTLVDGTKVDAPLMTQTEGFRYAEDESAQVLELPYQMGELSMVVLLPKSADGLAKMEEGLTADKLAAWEKAAKHAEVRVSLPRFRTEKEFSLAPVLKAMGMASAFSRGADFSGMTTAEKLFIAEVVHKAFVDVNEEGTEAAAATAVIMKRASAPPREPKVFRADHPFLFLIRENKTKSVLFLGRVENPRS